MTNQEIIAVVQASEDGQLIEFRHINSDPAGPWMTYHGTACWNFGLYDYRVKPELAEFWVNVYPDIPPACHETKAQADKFRLSNLARCIHVREVLS
jgi:hypothetical protein